jgi:hypothetical protein
MKYAERMELIEEKPLTENLLNRTASWTFPSLQEQFQFVIRLVDLLEEHGMINSDPGDGDGEVQRIDYRFLKDYEGFEIFVHYDFKVDLKEFGY